LVDDVLTACHLAADVGFRKAHAVSGYERSSGSVNVSSVLDADHHDFPLDLVDAAQDTEGAAPSCVDVGQVPAQSLADALWILDQGTGEELDDRSRYAFRQPGPNGANSGRSQDQFVCGLALPLDLRFCSVGRVETTTQGL
jgi:hypothetical protein